MKTVFVVRVVSRDIITDFVSRFRSILGGRVRAYERAIQEGLESAYEELKTKYPNITNVRFGTTEMMSDACEIILYGEVPDGTQPKEYNPRKPFLDF